MTELVLDAAGGRRAPGDGTRGPGRAGAHSASRNGRIIACIQTARSSTPEPGGTKCVVPGSTASWDFGRPARSPITPPPSILNISTTWSSRTTSESPTMISTGTEIPRTPSDQSKSVVSRSLSFHTDPGAHAEPDDVRALDPEMLHERRRVVGHPFVGDRPIGVAGPPVSLQLERNDPTVLSQRLQERRHPVDGHVSAVQQNERLPLAVDLVVDVQIVDLCVHAVSYAQGPNAPRQRHPQSGVAAALNRKRLGRGRPWSPVGARAGLSRTAATAGVRRRVAPHQLRHAHPVETAHEGVPLIVIERSAELVAPAGFSSSERSRAGPPAFASRRSLDPVARGVRALP